MATPIHDPFRAPLVGADTWTRVLGEAGWRCECTGECGRPHAKSEGRCLVEHGRGHRLIAAPINPAVSVVRATSAPLMAWCSGCADLAKRIAATHPDSTDPTQLDLFGGDVA